MKTLSPQGVNQTNHLELETLANQGAYYPQPPRRPFAFPVGSLVAVKRLSLTGKKKKNKKNIFFKKLLKKSVFVFFPDSSTLFGNKLSLTGYDSGKALVVKARKWKATGRRGTGRAPYYTGKSLSLSQLSLCHYYHCSRSLPYARGDTLSPPNPAMVQSP